MMAYFRAALVPIGIILCGWALVDVGFAYAVAHQTSIGVVALLGTAYCFMCGLVIGKIGGLL